MIAEEFHSRPVSDIVTTWCFAILLDIRLLFYSMIGYLFVKLDRWLLLLFIVSRRGLALKMKDYILLRRYFKLNLPTELPRLLSLTYSFFLCFALKQAIVHVLPTSFTLAQCSLVCQFQVVYFHPLSIQIKVILRQCYVNSFQISSEIECVFSVQNTILWVVGFQSYKDSSNSSV